MYRLYGVGFVMMAFGVMWAYDTYDKAANYSKVSAKVFDVTSVCHMEKEEGKKKWVSNKGPCDVARNLVETHPGYKGYTVRETAKIQYAYYVDGQEYTGEQERRSSKPIMLKDGDPIEILVSNDDPNKTRKP